MVHFNAVHVQIILLVGMKLELVIMEMAEQISERTTVVRGAPLVQPSNNFFWFNKPQWILFLIHFTLFEVNIAKLNTYAIIIWSVGKWLTRYRKVEVYNLSFAKLIQKSRSTLVWAYSFWFLIQIFIPLPAECVPNGILLVEVGKWSLINWNLFPAATSLIISVLKRKLVLAVRVWNHVMFPREDLCDLN